MIEPIYSIMSPTTSEVIKKKPYKFAYAAFTLSFFLPYRFEGYLHLSLDVVSLFGENLHGKVINGPWC